MTVLMYDGLNIDADAIHARYPGNPVAYYADGEWAWTGPEIAMFRTPGHIAISVQGTTPAARVLDVESGDAGPAEVKPFIEKRNSPLTTIYCDLYNVREVVDAVGDADLVPRWWLAWYWARPGYPTADQVAAKLRTETGVDLPASKIWACQFASYAQWDSSAVYGQPDFTH